ncbi:DUF4932 domain-containing protein [Anaerosalibacter bizertensis]|uniref:DUF4932 domain-containing protein n=1 Tax=Anaerosalibacter bizertensis TaxID=932217 RepID=A0A9Q4FKT0_9FIRM|nr:DUF4932 domain-containing protein [Anaerosalibacter bizertensis]MBV1816516.1 DUF4932 domain-containing protein [Bacteroidales bacterium MSK.15.36]MCB5559360.1 DUF4932 domain-containing protein [Anaerosalibacter bizertensis]MCG4563904.1 DUF4932 domain-containing protein [Anaerosalibacter bizertensis]MCG4581558.1 DUF4932 domain-containing protein [Anaerosalibacter bizertensis]
MYKIKSKISIIIFISILIGGLIIGCNNDKEISSINNYKESLKKPITITKNSLNIMIDPRIELLSIVQYLSNYDEEYDLMTKYDFEYRGRVDEYFTPFKEHKAVKLFDRLSDKGFLYHIPPETMLYMTNKFKLREDIDMSEYLIENKKELEEFYESLYDFFRDTKFNDFYDENEEYYFSLVENVSHTIDGEDDIIKELEEYYGIKQKSYNLILVSLYTEVGFGIRLGTVADEGYEIYSVIGPTVSNNNVGFGSKTNFNSIQIHEFSHSFINPLTEKYWNEAKKYSKLYIPVKDTMEKEAYGDWESCLNEHIIRAITARFNYKKDKSLGDNTIEWEKENGFIYIDKLLEKLDEYDNNRDIYPTFESFYPELLKSLDYYIENSNM